MNFDIAFNKLVDPQHEGGYVDNPDDPGGETKYGISKRSYPNEDIPNLTLDRAKWIYRRDFWTPLQCDALPDTLRFELFDLAVNTSAPGDPKTAVRMLQEALGVPADGKMGPLTITAANTTDPQRALRRLQALRLKHYTGLDKQWRDDFLTGVVNRVADNMLEV